VAFQDDRFQELRVPLTWTGAAALLLAAAVALVLMLGDRREARLETAGAEAYRPLQAGFDAALAPVSATLSAPVRWTGDLSEYVRGYFFAVSENRRLRAKVAEGERWRQAAVALKDANDRYASLLQLRTEPPIPMVGARVIADVRGPYANARLADSGSERGVRIGNPAMTDQGLLGRVVGVAPGASRILLLTDVASRTPVMVDRTNARAILTGDGGPNPRMEFIRGRDAVRPGDVILSSGDGGVIPRGLPVGEAARGVDGVWRVRLYTDRSPMDLVRILQFKDFSQEIDRETLARSEMPPAPPLPPRPAASAAPIIAPAAASPAARPAAPAGATAAPSTATPAPAPTPAATSPEPVAAPAPPVVAETASVAPPQAAAP
jgi:rod shape-determining protein MreC